MWTWPEGGRFKKEGKPWNWRPVGSERHSSGGVMVKVAEPDQWRFKHQLVWEKANGPLPRGFRIYFIDGDRFNCALDNLRARPLVLIGEEREGPDGYIQVRVASGKWRRKHLVIWEAAHGPLPPKYALMFLDGDFQNCRLENLVMVPKNRNRWRLNEVSGPQMRPLAAEMNRLEATCGGLRSALSSRLTSMIGLNGNG